MYFGRRENHVYQRPWSKVNIHFWASLQKSRCIISVEKKISSEMEVAPRYMLFTLLTLFTHFSLLTMFTLWLLIWVMWLTRLGGPNWAYRADRTDIRCSWYGTGHERPFHFDCFGQSEFKNIACNGLWEPYAVTWSDGWMDGMGRDKPLRLLWPLQPRLDGFSLLKLLKHSLNSGK